MRLRALAPAKVNLCLFLGPTRADGRHDLVTVYQSLSLCDELVLETREAVPDEVVCPEVPGENLVTRTLAALRERGWAGPPVTVAITKRIPVAAGMAGGSADAAAALRLAVELAPGRAEEVAALAAELGSDVPAQLSPGVSLGTGGGEVVESLQALAPHAYLVVPLAAELSTPAVYREADRLELPRSADQLADRLDGVRAVLTGGAQLPRELLVNDLEPAALSLCPEIGPALDAVRAAGAEHAMVSGSGPTVVGLWWGERALRSAEAAAAELAGRYAGAAAATPVEASIGVPVLV